MDVKSLIGVPTAWADAKRGLHALFVIIVVWAEIAVMYTMHSARHVYPTCAFRLLFPPGGPDPDGSLGR